MKIAISDDQRKKYGKDRNIECGNIECGYLYIVILNVETLNVVTMKMGTLRQLGVQKNPEDCGTSIK